MTAPFFSATSNQKISGSEGLSSTAYTFGCRFLVSATYGGNHFFFNATNRTAEFGRHRPGFFITPARVLRIAQEYSLSTGIWTVTAVTMGVWHTLFVTHNRSSTETPVVYYDRALVAISAVVNQTASGTPLFPSLTAGFVIGGRTGHSDRFFGHLQHVVFANSVWTQAQCNQFASAPGSFMQNVRFYYPFARPDDDTDYGGNSVTLSAVDNTSGAAVIDSTASGGIRRMKLLGVGV